MSKRKFNEQPEYTPPRGFGAYIVWGQDGKVNGYIDRPVCNGVYANPLLIFETPASARTACLKLAYAGRKFGKWAMFPTQAVEILNSNLYPKAEPIAWVVCARRSGWRDEGVTYVLREWTDEDAKDLEAGEPDVSIVFESTDYEQAQTVRSLLHREFQLNGTRAMSAQEVRAVLEAYAHTG